MTTADMVADSRLVEDGQQAVTDTAALTRWVRCFQNASDLVWNDRLWNFKLITLLSFQFDPDPLAGNLLPSDFSSFEGLGAGVYGTMPVRQLNPMYASEINAAMQSLVVQTGLPSGFAVTYTQGVPRLLIWPLPTQIEPLNLIYLRKKPALNIDPLVDELYAIPEQWHCVVQRGGEWQNKMKSGSGSADPYKELWKANLEEMRARERNGGTSLNTLARWEPDRLPLVGGGF